MAIDLIPARFESGDTFQFTLTMTANRPNTVAFGITDFIGNVVSLSAVQSGAVVAESGTTTGAFYFNRVLPTTVGFYFYEWLAWDAASRPYAVRGELEIYHTRAFSFHTYADVQDTLKTARRIFDRGDITVQDLQRYFQAGDGEIDAKLAPVATVPLSLPAPEPIPDISKVFCLWRYYCDRYSIEREGAPPAIISRKEAYDDLLQMLISGSASIPGIIDATAEAGTISTIGTAYKPVFDMRDWIDHRISPQLIDYETDRDNAED